MLRRIPDRGKPGSSKIGERRRLDACNHISLCALSCVSPRGHAPLNRLTRPKKICLEHSCASANPGRPPALRLLPRMAFALSTDYQAEQNGGAPAAPTDPCLHPTPEKGLRSKRQRWASGQLGVYKRPETQPDRGHVKIDHHESFNYGFHCTLLAIGPMPSSISLSACATHFIHARS